MTLIGKAHSGLVFGRRVRVLARHLCRALPEGARVLDVGCGDGTLDAMLMKLRPDVSIHGVDINVRSDTRIPVAQSDGRALPYEDESFDVVLFVDVLHHTQDPLALMREGTRVSRRHVLIKDHIKEGLLAGPTLRLMDWVGNAHHGVALPYNYWSATEWNKAFQDLGFAVERWVRDLGLYVWPATLVFDRQLHFVARLAKRNDRIEQIP